MQKFHSSGDIYALACVSRGEIFSDVFEPSQQHIMFSVILICSGKVVSLDNIFLAAHQKLFDSKFDVKVGLKGRNLLIKVIVQAELIER